MPSWNARPVEERITEKIDRSAGPGACWPWIGAVGQFGVPRTTIQKRGVSPRRILWEAHRGQIPENRTVTVTCGNSRCLNLEHLALRAYGDDVSRFWENVEKPSGDGCWVWTGHRVAHRGGYGIFKLRGNRPMRAHRYSYELAHGPIDDPRLFVCHHCDNPMCVRPEHLFLGTAKDNHDDMVRKGRHARGPKLSAAVRASRERRAAS